VDGPNKVICDDGTKYLIYYIKDGLVYSVTKKHALWIVHQMVNVLTVYVFVTKDGPEIIVKYFHVQMHVIIMEYVSVVNATVTKDG
jgi:hypothetical protein